MKAWLSLLALSLTLFLAGPAFSGQFFAASPPEVREEVDLFQGNQALFDNQIRAVMTIKQPDWRFWRRPVKITPQALRRDKEAILRLYRNHGYYQAWVELEVDRVGKRERIIVHVEEGPPVKIRRVDLVVEPPPGSDLAGLEAVPEQAGLAKERVFCLADLRQAKAAMLRFLAERGHPGAKAEGRAQVSVSGCWADIRLQVELGPRLRMGPARFSGQTRTRFSALEPELPWSGGEVYDVRLLEKAEQRLMDLGLFSMVRLRPLTGEASGGRVPIEISLKERSRHSISLGVGYGSEDHARIRLTQSNRSVLGRGEILSLSGEYSDLIAGGLVEYRQPNILAGPQSLSIQLGHRDEDHISFSNQRTFGWLGLKRMIQRPWWLQVGYGLRRMRPFGLAAGTSLADREDYTVSAPALALSYDTRDNILDPKRGLYFNLKGEVSTDVLGSDLNYLLLEAKISAYQPLTPWLVLAGRFRATTIRAFGSTDYIPISERFFCGGDQSVRGYPYDRLGPLLNGDKPAGGMSLLVAGVEGRFPLWGDLAGAVFVDAGNLQPEPDRLDLADTRFTTGFGLRYKTALGPLRADLGWQLNPPEKADFSRF
ncbi:MAG: BamA/TamA family outer membrane protein, partial [Deltaproteobacteria bacterium]|nr:BamA/TamA family outer membrane protein [Deltaproteobacteria bacterium]